MVDGLALLRQQLDAAFSRFRSNPDFANFDALQQAMNAYQRALNAWRDS